MFYHWEFKNFIIPPQLPPSNPIRNELPLSRNNIEAFPVRSGRDPLIINDWTIIYSGNLQIIRGNLKLSRLSEIDLLTLN